MQYRAGPALPVPADSVSMTIPPRHLDELPDYPFRGHFATVNGLQLHYLDEGPPGGEVLLMLHGNPTWSFYYRSLVLALRGTYRCIVPDHIGMGRSESPPPAAYGYRLANRVDDLESLLDQLELPQRITLVLHDWGGMIGMAWACRHPDRIARLILFNTAAFHPPPGVTLPWQLRLARMPIIGPLLVQGGNAFCRGAAATGSARGGLPAPVRTAYLLPHCSWSRRYAVLAFVRDIPVGPAHPSYTLVSRVEEGLGRLTATPMLVCWGLRDFVFHPGFLASWRERFPAAEVTSYENAGHLLLEDAGAEVAARVGDFLARHPG